MTALINWTWVSPNRVRGQAPQQSGQYYWTVDLSREPDGGFAFTVESMFHGSLLAHGTVSADGRVLEVETKHLTVEAWVRSQVPWAWPERRAGS